VTGGPGSIWGVLMNAKDEYVDFEVDEEGLWLEGVLTLPPDQTLELSNVLNRYYAEEV
jgi:hypothetical protein